MKRLILLATLFIAFNQASTAQITLQFTEDTIWANEPIPKSSLSRLAYLKNLSGDSVYVIWIKEEVMVPDAWSSAVCDKELCWDTNTITREFGMEGNEEADLYGYVYTDSTRGTAVVRVIAHEKENTNNADTLYIMARQFNPVGVNNVEKANIQVYPNPARTSVTVKLPANAKGGVIEVYDILGNKLLIKDVTADEVEVDVSNLPDGKYILRYIDHDGTAYTKRFQKV